MKAPRLSDGVIALDQHTLADAGAHLAGEDEEQARRFGWHPATSSLETVSRAIDRWQHEWLSDGPTRAFAMREQTGALAGGCEVRLRNDALAEMSYWTFPAFRHHGYATRAVRLACE